MSSRQKLLALLVAGTIAVSGLSGCGTQQQEEEEQEEQQEQEEYVDVDISHKTKKNVASSLKSLGSSAKGSVSA